MFAAGLAVLLVIEVGGLFYVDRSYLQERTNDITVQQITSNVSSEAANIEVGLDSSAKNIKCSYDGNYLSYTLDDELEVLNLTTGVKTQIDMDDDMELGFYKWVYDRDQLIIAETSSSSSHHYAKLYNLNAKEISTDSKPAEIRDTVNNKEAKITMPSTSSYISDIDFSTSTVTTYLKITNKYDKSILWKFNIPDENKAYSYISSKNIGNIQCLKNESELLYENEANGKVCIAGEGALKIGGETKFQLLGYDGSDNIYLAKGDGTTTNEILYGSLVNETLDGDESITLEPEMKTVKVSESADISDIYIALSGGIYQNDSTGNVFKNLVTGEETAYRGTVKAVYSKGFITVSDGIVMQNSFD